MDLHLSEQPGPHERHVRRKLHNPLFPAAQRLPDPELLHAAQRRDLEEQEAFLAEFHALVREAAELAPNAESEVIIALRDRLDRAYVMAAGLRGNHTKLTDALKRLIDSITLAMRRAAADDPQAAFELNAETEARRHHYELLQHPLVSDLIRPDSPIAPDELAATLLSEPEAAVRAAAWVFAPEELTVIVDSARSLLAHLETEGPVASDLRRRLEALEAEAQIPQAT